MKFTLSWLKDHLDTSASLDEIVDTLTMIGLEVERVEDKAKDYAPFKVVQILEAEQHPNADRLRVCQVDNGSGKPLQIVCGAPNARAGLKTVLGLPGTYIPAKDITLSVGKIRGVESHGMMISGAEIGFNDDHGGIIELPADAPIGTPFAEVLGISEPVIEINLTPNRPDCTGVNGIARDLGATLIGDYKENAPKRIAGTFPCPVQGRRSTAPELCPAFALRLVRGVKNGPSPEWLQKRLTAIGLRPINALVDITNYITYDRGRPLHVFDAKKVKGNLTVRRAQNGETLLALDGKTYTLDQGMCVIADETRGRIARRHHGRRGVRLRRDHHRRADRIGAVERAQHRADRPQARHQHRRALPLRARRRSGLHRARPRSGDADGARPLRRRAVRDRRSPAIRRRKDKVIDFPLSEVPRLSGLELPLTDVRRVLEKLGFFVAGQGERVKVAVPSWRPDVHGRADIVEEVVRIVGVDKVPPTPFPRGENARKPVLTPIQMRTRKAKRALAARGLVEAVTWSFVSKREAELFGGGQARACARQSDRGRALRHAAEPAAGPDHGGAAQCRPRLRRRRAVRGRADFQGRQAGRPVHRRDRHPPRAGEARRRRPPLVARDAPVDAFDAKADAYAVLAAAARRCRRCRSCPADRRGCIPAAAAPSRWGRRTSSAISANCIRARWRR